MFPALRHPTGELKPPPDGIDTDMDRTAMAPRRKQTRDQDRRDRINAERRQRIELNTEEQRQRQLLADALARDDEPPPF